jgi:hypothetical protein
MDSNLTGVVSLVLKTSGSESSGVRDLCYSPIVTGASAASIEVILFLCGAKRVWKVRIVAECGVLERRWV